MSQTMYAVGVNMIPRRPNSVLDSWVFVNLDAAIDRFMMEVVSTVKYAAGGIPTEDGPLLDLYKEFVEEADESARAYKEFMTGRPDNGVPGAGVLKAVVETDCAQWLHHINKVEVP